MQVPGGAVQPPQGHAAGLFPPQPPQGQFPLLSAPGLPHGEQPLHVLPVQLLAAGRQVALRFVTRQDSQEGEQQGVAGHLA